MSVLSRIYFSTRSFKEDFMKRDHGRLKAAPEQKRLEQKHGTYDNFKCDFKIKNGESFCFKLGDIEING